MESIRPPLESGGVSSTLSPVNSWSKYLVSVSLTTWGLKGGVILFFSRSDQLMLLKKGWVLTALKGWNVKSLPLSYISPELTSRLLGLHLVDGEDL